MAIRSRPKTDARGKSPSKRRDTPRDGAGHLYLQVARTLREEIVDGLYPPGAQLPTEEALCKRFSVSRYTVREALRRLREDHLISSRPRAGTRVVPRHVSGTYAQDVMSINDLVSWAAGKHYVIQSIEMLTIDARLAASTGLERGESWLAVRGLGTTDGEATPYCWAEYYIHRDYAAVGRLLMRHTGPIFPLLEDLFGLTITEVHQEIAATLVSPQLAGSLKAEAGSAALEVSRAYRTAEGKLAQLTISTHPAARYRHSMTMRRIEG